MGDSLVVLEGDSLVDLVGDNLLKYYCVLIIEFKIFTSMLRLPLRRIPLLWWVTLLALRRIAWLALGGISAVAHFRKKLIPELKESNEKNNL